VSLQGSAGAASGLGDVEILTSVTNFSRISDTFGQLTRTGGVEVQRSVVSGHGHVECQAQMSTHDWGASPGHLVIPRRPRTRATPVAISKSASLPRLRGGHRCVLGRPSMAWNSLMAVATFVVTVSWPRLPGPRGVATLAAPGAWRKHHPPPAPRGRAGFRTQHCESSGPTPPARAPSVESFRVQPQSPWPHCAPNQRKEDGAKDE
jgi:hypothetical protein